MKSIFNSLGSNYIHGSAAYRVINTDAHAFEKLQQYLVQRYNSKAAYVTYKGREAITLILRSLNVPAGSLVALNGYTCYAVYQAVTAAGLTPYYLDVAENELNFNAQSLALALEERPAIKVVMIQNTLGMPCDIAGIKQVCDQHQVELVEDLAHCIGMKYGTGVEAGTISRAAALSFSQDKMVDAVTGGAAIFNSNPPTEPSYRSASLWHRFATRLYPGSSLLVRNTTHIIVGKVLLRFLKLTRLLPGPMNGEATIVHRLPSWHSTLAMQAYQQLADVIVHRQHIASIYRELLPLDIQFQHASSAIYLRFPIRVKEPIKLIEYLKNSRIYVGDRWYDAPISPKRTLASTNYQPGQCPNAELAASSMVNLPTHRNVTENQARFIAEKVNEWLK